MTELATRGGATPRAEELEDHRGAITGYCYRMLGSLFEAEDAAQETMIRGWKSLDRFEGRSTLKSWLYRIATNVCLDMLDGRNRRARPMDLGPSGTADSTLNVTGSDFPWLQPMPDSLLVPAAADPADMAVERDSIRLAFVAALQHLPPRQRAVLILRDVLRWPAADVAELLATSVPSVNSALQRARTTLAERNLEHGEAHDPLDADQQQLLERYVDAFQRYDMQSLTALLHSDAMQSMPPYTLWLRGREEILRFWKGPGAGCAGSLLIPMTANGAPAFAQYKPSGPGGSFEPWALQVLEIRDGAIAEFSFFLEPDDLFQRCGLPLHPNGSEGLLPPVRP